MRYGIRQRRARIVRAGQGDALGMMAPDQLGVELYKAGLRRVEQMAMLQNCGCAGVGAQESMLKNCGLPPSCDQKPLPLNANAVAVGVPTPVTVIVQRYARADRFTTDSFTAPPFDISAFFIGDEPQITPAGSFFGAGLFSETAQGMGLVTTEQWPGQTISISLLNNGPNPANFRSALKNTVAPNS